MAPTYAISLGLCMWLFAARGRTSARAETPAPWPRLKRRLGIGLAVFALKLATVLPLVVPVFRLPVPSGPYPIGTLTYHLRDLARLEVFTANPDDHRALMVQVWYPAKTSESAPRTRYVPDGEALAPLARLLNLPGFMLTHLKWAATNGVYSAPISERAATYPVLIFSHGRGGFRQHNTAQIEDLVSHGYVVAAIDHAYAAAGVDFPDGERASLDPRMLDRRFIDGMLPYLAQDVSFTLDQLAAINRVDPRAVLGGRLNLQQVGVFGVSIGGAVIAEACLRDAHLKACLSIDNFMPASVVQKGLLQPTMWIGRDVATMQDEGWAQADIEEIQSTVRQAFEGPGRNRYLLLIPGMFHPNFSDFPYFVRAPFDRWLGLDGPINARRGHAIVNAYALAFFDRHLRGAAPLLDRLNAQYPEVSFERRN